MKRMLLSIFAFSLSLCAADFTGKWVGTYSMGSADGDNQSGNVTLILTQTGSDVTGTVGTDTGETHQIAKGHADSDQITFEAHTDGPAMKVTLHFEDGHLRGVAKGEDDDGNKIEAKVDLTRKADQ